MIWILFGADRNKGFPNFFPVGIYETKEQAEKDIELLPKKNNRYQLFQFPLNIFFGVFDANGKVQSKLGRFEHAHFEEEEEET